MSYSNPALVTICGPYRINEILLSALNGLVAVIAVTAVAVRLKHRDRRFLFQRARRPAGDFLVHNAPVLTCCFIVVYALLAGSSTLLSLQSYRQSVRDALRVTALITPFPIFAWTWCTAFSPVFATHLYSTDAVRARWPKLGVLTQLRPRTLNAICYATPLVVLVPVFVLSGITSTVGSAMDLTVREYYAAESQGTSDLQPFVDAIVRANDRYFAVYSSLWSVWAAVFIVPAVVYICYSLILLPILTQEIDALDSVPDLRLSPESVSPIVCFEGDGAVTPEDKSVCSDSTNRPPFSRSSTKRSRLDLRRIGLQMAWRAELGQLTRLELMRANTRLVCAEAVVNTVMCLALATFSVAKAAMASIWLQDPDKAGVSFLIANYIDMTYALLTASLLLWRGINASRVASTPRLPQMAQLAGAAPIVRSQLHVDSHGPAASFVTVQILSPTTDEGLSVFDALALSQSPDRRSPRSL